MNPMFFIGAVLRWAVLLGYLVCAWLYVSRLVGARSSEDRGPAYLLSLVVACHALLLVESAIEHGRLVFLSTALQATTIYALALGVFTLIAGARTKNQAFGAFTVPIALLFYGLSLAYRTHSTGINPLLDSNWFEVHAMSAFLGYSAFALSFVAGVMYLLLMGEIRRRSLGRLFTRLPSLEMLDQLGFRSVLLGFLLFSTAMLTGSIWAHQAFGSWFSGEPKELWAFATWVVGAVHLIARMAAGWRGWRTAWLAIAGFVISIVTWLGAGLISPGRHSL